MVYSDEYLVLEWTEITLIQLCINVLSTVKVILYYVANSSDTQVCINLQECEY